MHDKWDSCKCDFLFQIWDHLAHGEMLIHPGQSSNQPFVLFIYFQFIFIFVWFPDLLCAVVSYLVVTCLMAYYCDNSAISCRLTISVFLMSSNQPFILFIYFQFIFIFVLFPNVLCAVVSYLVVTCLMAYYCDNSAISCRLTISVFLMLSY